MTATRPPLEDDNGHVTATRRPREDKAPQADGRPPAPTLSRRQFLPRAAAAAAGLVVAGVVGYELPHHSASRRRVTPASPKQPSTTPPATGASGSSRVQSFLTRPDLRPPVVRVTQIGSRPVPESTPRFILLAPMNAVPASDPQQGLMMLDRQGRLVWFAPGSDATRFNLDAQSYRAKPALTWWQGSVSNAHGYGVGEIADETYNPVAAIHAGHGLQTDLHDLQLTSRGTALITAYETTTADLSSIGASSKGQVFVGHVQEVDLKTGRVLFDWNSLDHVGIDESLQPPPHTGQGYDYFHLNSVAETDDGHLLISARNTCAIYKVNRSSGKILWRLNGKRSDFSVSSTAAFWWQHDARPHGASVISVFDNAGVDKAKQSRGLVLSVNEATKRVELTRAFVNPAGFIAGTLGNVQLLRDGGAFVGWGSQSYFSQFAPDGTLILDGQMPVGVRSYRAHLTDWVGRPADGPRIVAQSNPAGGFVVHVSWNGATEVARWTVLAGRDGSSLAAVGSQAWSGFETAIEVNSEGPAFCAVALDANGREIGRSPVI
ncbi:MAG TPA: arylsulfotransferase family protein [Solirubrobacteraceae bacterium]|jgi:outer membrane protein assembly factor BamB|nr:arylsulfotransferase family protein [Solirubrobacteraceae bacterium]